MRKIKCGFCHKLFESENRSLHAKYCSKECRESFSKISHRILMVMGIDEFEKFCKQGNNYRFHGKYERFNAYYGLKTEVEQA
jgi:hypothetical protein